MYRLSVLLPNYNNGEFLESCLESLMNQTFQDFHIFFVDDCSTDNSIEVLSKFPKEKYTLIQLAKQTGIVGALNAGLEKIESEYLIRMDGDDYCELNRFEKLVQFLDQNQDYHVCGSSIQAFGLRDDVQVYTTDSNLNCANLIFGHSIGHATCIFRTSLFKNNGIKYLNDFYRLEDYQLFYTLMKFAKMISIPEVLYYYRQEEYNFNAEIEAKKIIAYQQFYRMVLSDLLENTTKEDVEMHLQLANKKNLTFSIKEFDKFVDKLRLSNQKAKIFPKKEFDMVLLGKLNQVKFRQIDNKSMGLGELFKYGAKDFSLIKHFIKKRLKR